MAATHHLPDLEAATTNDSVASSPRSEHDLHPCVRFMCSFGGKILPRPHDNLLRYVGGDTRIVAVQRTTTFNALLSKLSKLSGTNQGTTNITVKYQLPNEDLDALISVTTDEDVENMMEEYDRVAQTQNPRTARLRLFLFSKGDDSRASSISSLLDSTSNREQWFLDALNDGGGLPPGPGLERLRSEASSIVSEVPDYLFGLETSEELKPKARSVLPETVSISDPGSPAPVANSSYCSTSSACVPSMPDLPPVKTKPENPVPKSDPNEGQSFAETGETIVVQPGGYPGNPAGHFAPSSHYSGPPMQPMPVYYIASPMAPGHMSGPPIMARGPYVQQYPASASQIPIGYHQPATGPGQVYGGVVRSVVADGVSHQVYYGVSNGGMVPTYPPGMVVPAPGGEDIQVVAAEAKPGRISQQS